MNENIHGKIICHLMNEKITWAPTKGNNLRSSTLVAWAMAATKSMHQVLQFNMPKASYKDHLSDSTPLLSTSPPGSFFFHPPTSTPPQHVLITSPIASPSVYDQPTDGFRASLDQT